MEIFKKIGEFCSRVAEAYSQALSECNPYFEETLHKEVNNKKDF